MSRIEPRASALLVALALGVVPAGRAHAQSVSVQARFTEAVVAVGDYVTLEVQAATDSINGNIDVNVPPQEGLNEVRRSASESSSFSFINNTRQVRRERTIRIDFEAIKPGNYRVQDITAQVGGTRQAAPPISIRVVETTTALASTPTPGGIVPPRPEEGNLFVRYRVNKASAYLGEQIILDLDIFTNASFNLEDAKGPPDLDGFWKEVIEKPTRLQSRIVNVAGKRWRAYRLWRVAIFPLQAGLRTIGKTPLTFSMNRSVFSTGQRLRRAAPPIKLEILPLPTEGRPSGFVSTNVGNYRMSTIVDAQRVPAGKAVVLKVALRGAGNVKNAKLPTLPAVDGFRVFPPTVRDSIATNAGGVSGTKEAEIILMPLRGGRLTVPALSLPIFNPATKAYATLNAPAIPIFVDGDPTAAPRPPSGAVPPPSDPTGNTRGLAAKLDSPKLSSTLEPPAPPLRRRPLFLLLLLAPPLLFGLALLTDAVRGRLGRETPASRLRQAAREAHVRLGSAREAAEAGQAAEACSRIHETLLSFGTEKTKVAIRGLTMEETRAALLDCGVPEDLVDRLVQELEHCDFARFAPGAQDPEAISAALDRADQILSDLEAWEAT